MSPAEAKSKATTRVFQAIRIAVNDELGSLERALLTLPAVVRPGGRVVVLSYHSLEVHTSNGSVAHTDSSLLTTKM